MVRHVLVCALIAIAACGGVPSNPDSAPPPDPDALVSPDAMPGMFTLSVQVAGPATGTVSSSPAGIDCGATCDLSVVDGTMVTLTATPDAGATFAGWSGGGCSGTGTCVVTVDADVTVTASFEVATFTVDLSLMGSGTGTVTSDPPGLSCPGTCSMTAPFGTMVTLTATPATGSTFLGWGGVCSGTGSCVINLSQDVTVMAAFAANNDLVVMKAGNGSGAVTSSPAGIDCGLDCTEGYAPGSIITLTATPATGSVFAGWSGGGCTGTGQCTVTLTAPVMVTATFNLTQHTLTVQRLGAGTGTVTSNPAGINCGADCSEVLNFGTMITLTASPAANSTFAGWSGGGCSGTGTCNTTITAATTVSATFNLIQHSLTVVRTGPGGGTVTSNPSGINCGADCSEVYGQGTMVTLTHAEFAGSVFAGWSGGGCSGTGQCTVTMNAATTVTATYNAMTIFTMDDWSCATGVSCTDYFDVTVPASTNVTIAVSSVTGFSVVRLGAFAPGVPVTGANLLTGVASDRECVGQNTNDTVQFRATNAGTYRIGVGRDWGSSAGASGTYNLTISATQAMTAFSQFANDVAPGTAQTRCGYLFTVSSGWSCASGVSCQDTYRFDTLGTTTMTVAVTAVTGNSVPRLAVFNGTTVTTTNQLNGMLTDRRCVGQNASDTATSASLPVGAHLAAIGRDWGLSAGASGTYTYTVTTPNLPLIPLGQVTNDTGSAFSTTSCP